MATSLIPGSEGNGWRSPVSAKPQRWYSARAGAFVSVTHRCTEVARRQAAQPTTAATSASPRPRPRPRGRTYMETSSTVTGSAW